jgi:ubiquinone/menaquinone biosynthesis C-methylase UbiE
LYGKSADYYDAIYGWKDYKRESDLIRQFTRRYKKSKGRALLDVACGTGSHITHFKKRFNVEGLDADLKMLKQARRKHPEIKFYQQDMCSFQLGKKYDVVTCLFSAIGHVKTLYNLQQAIARMASHIEPGGLMILEPWITPRQWKVGSLHGVFVNRPDLKLARISISNRKERLSHNDEHFLIGTRRGIEHFVERLEMGLFTDRDYRRAIKRAGLIVRYDRKGLTGRGLYFGLKPVQ